MSMITRLVYARRGPFKRFVKEALALYGVEIPSGVEVGSGLRVMHRGFGTVIHPNTTIGKDVTIFHDVTVGRGDPWVAAEHARMGRVYLDDGVTLCPGARILCTTGDLHVGRGTVVGANAVLTRSTGINEIWAGIPARRLSIRAVENAGLRGEA